MYLLYLDEFGHPGPYDPGDKRHRHHPLFGFAGFVIPGERWRDFDRSYLRLKKRFYKVEIERAETLEGIRSERFEPKSLTSTRDIRFASHVIGLIGKCGGHVFTRGCEKTTTVKNHSYRGLYLSLMQTTLRAFEKYLRDAAGKRVGRGVVVMDRRTEAQNTRVLESAQSLLFSHSVFRKDDVRVTDIPLLVPSEWYHGVQAADGVGRVVGASYWFRRLNDPRFKERHDKLYPLIRAHTRTIGGWHSVHVR